MRSRIAWAWRHASCPSPEVSTSRDADISSEDLALFDALLIQTDQFLTDGTGPPRERRVRAAEAIPHASRQVRDLVGSALTAGTPIGVELRRDRDGDWQGSDYYQALPNPLSLLILGAARFQAGDDVTVIIQRAGCPDLRRHARWPFGLPVAEQLTRPDRTPSTTSSTCEEPSR